MSERFVGGSALSGVTISALPQGHVALLLTRAGAPAPMERLRPMGPGQWLLVGEGPADLAGLAERLPGVAVSDQSHGRVRIGLTGPGAAAALAQGTAVDLEALAVGASAATMLGPIGVHLTRTGAESWELIVLRSFAEALWGDLREMAEGV